MVLRFRGSSVIVTNMFSATMCAILHFKCVLLCKTGPQKQMKMTKRSDAKVRGRREEGSKHGRRQRVGRKKNKD